MQNISKALVIAIQYLGSQRNDEEFNEDDDIKIVEEVSLILREATFEEKNELISAANALGLNEWPELYGIDV